MSESNEREKIHNIIDDENEKLTGTDVLCIMLFALVPLCIYAFHNPVHNACVDYIITWCAWEVGIAMFEVCILLVAADVVVGFFAASHNKIERKTE